MNIKRFVIVENNKIIIDLNGHEHLFEDVFNANEVLHECRRIRPLSHFRVVEINII